MVDLRSSAALLIANPLVPLPPVEGVVARARRYRAARRRRQLGAGLVLVALMLTAVARSQDGLTPDAVHVVDDPRARLDRDRPFDDPPVGDVVGQAYPWIGPSSAPSSEASSEPPDDSWSRLVKAVWCPETKQRIRVLLNEPASSFRVSLSADAKAVVKGVIDKANKKICGDITLVETHDDVLHDLAGYTAVIGLPGDPALERAIDDGSVDRAGIPVVGGDGLSLAQHRSPWVFPVSPSAAALTRIAVDHGRAGGGRTFAFVYDDSHAWGREAKAAFDSYVDRVGGRRAVDIPLDPAALSYREQVEHFSDICHDSLCDVVVLAVDQPTARRWFVQNPVPPRIETSALPMLMGSQFAQDCGLFIQFIQNSCPGLKVWNPFNASLRPSVSPNDELAAYGETVGYNPDPFVEGAFIAARALVRALDTYSAVDKPYVARFLERLPYASALVPALTWESPTARQTNNIARLYELRVTDSTLVWSETWPATWWRDPQ